MAEVICGNAHKCAAEFCLHREVHDAFHSACQALPCSTHTAKKDRPCVSVNSKRGWKVLGKMGVALG